MKFGVPINNFPEDFFEVIPGAFFDIAQRVNFFVFNYELIGDNSRLVYDNPFNGNSVDVTFPNIGGGGIIGLIVDGIENLFNISLSITFFDILVGPVLFIALAYAFIKFLNPVR